MQGMPSYDNLNEKPSLFDEDRGNDAKLAFMIHLEDSLVCFEQLAPPALTMSEAFDSDPTQFKNQNYFTKTVAFRGDVYFKIVFEKMNHIKEELIHASKVSKKIKSSYVSTLVDKKSIIHKDGNLCHPLSSTVLKINKL